MKWENLRWILALLVAIAIGFAVYGGAQYFFQANVWVSLLLAVIGGLYSAVVPTLELVKKFYDVRKAPYELRKLQREEADANREKHSRIHRPTDDQVERILTKRYRASGQITLSPKSFISASREENT